MFNSLAAKIISVIMSVVPLFSGFIGNFDQVQGVEPKNAERYHYGSQKTQVYDLFIPEDVGSSCDLIFTIHGGAWIFGTQTIFTQHCEMVCDEYKAVCVSMDYSKLIDGVNCEGMLDEIDTCISHVKQIMINKGISVNNFAIAGHSAGAHLSVLYSYKRYRTCPYKIAAVAGFSTPTSFYSSEKNTVLGKSNWLVASFLSGTVVTPLSVKSRKSYLDSISPVANVTKDVPPTILIHGDSDTIVNYKQSVDLYNVLQATGVKSELITIPGADHMLSQFENTKTISAPAILKFISEIFD